MRNKTRRNRKSKAVKTLSHAALRALVMEEAQKLSGELEDISSVEAQEVDADEYGDSLESDIDMYKAMEIKEAKMRRQYNKLVREARKVRRNKMIAKKRILRQLK